jgi:hypothetical protein
LLLLAVAEEEVTAHLTMGVVVVVRAVSEPAADLL